MSDDKASPSAGAQESTEPSDIVRHSVSDFAEANDVDPEALLAGARFECNGLGAWFRHYGSKDPNGIVLAIDMGELDLGDGEDKDKSKEEGGLVPALRFALEYNLVIPAALHGYYALTSGATRLAYCVRIDLAAVENGGDAISAMIASLVHAVEHMHETLRKQFAAASADEGAPKVFA